MTAPTPYNRLTNFQSYQAVNPTTPLNGANVDGEYNRLKITTDSLIASLALIQRSDGELANQSVGADQLAPELALGFHPPVTWTTATDYPANQGVFIQNQFYISTAAHTSGNFATDLAHGLWYLAADFSAAVAGTGALVIGNNLSDVASVQASRANLGIDSITFHGNSDYNIAATDRFVALNAALTAPRTWTLPQASTLNAGQSLAIGDNFGGVSATNTLIIQRNGIDTINGRTIFVLQRAFQGVALWSDGISKWFTAGQTVDATVPRGHLAGCQISPVHGGTTFSVTTGSAATDDGTALMTLLTLTKSMASTWVVGSGNGGLDTGANIVGSWYHVYVIRRVDTGVVDVLYSLSPSSPTMPANYTQKRRIGSIYFGGAGLNGYVQNGDEFLWVNPSNDANGVGVPGTGTGRLAYALLVPTGVKVNALMNVLASNPVAGYYLCITSLDQNDSVGNANLSLAMTLAGVVCSGNFSVRTDTSGRVGFRATAPTANTLLVIGTQGWIDTRGRFA